MAALKSEDHAWFRRQIFISLISVFSLLAFIPVFTYFAFAHSLQTKDGIMNKNDTGVILLDRNNKPFYSFYQAKYKENIPISQMPDSIQKAVIASEDKDFYSHPGFSISAIIRSLSLDIMKKDTAYGGSTLTQQLVKNALLSPSKSFVRKYEELVLAQEIERRYSKNEILEMYLNSVYFGEGAFGIEEAAGRYFGKHASNLSVAESAMLAAVLPSPSALSPVSGDYEGAKKRQQIILEKMYEQGYITQAQEKTGLAQPLVFSKMQEVNAEALHFALFVRDYLIQKYGEETVSRSGFHVKTTIDLDNQTYAETVVKNQVALLSGNHATNGAAVVLDPKTGEILSMVGSVDWNNASFGKVNMVTTPRQPGSSFKPIVYSLALDRHIITPATPLKDEPTTFPGNYKPLDYDKKFRGIVLARRALANSLNIPAVQVLSMVGVPDAIDMAHRLGITTLSDPTNYGLSLVLGSGEVKLIDMATVYATFANSGNKPEITPILQIQDKDNNTIYKFSPNVSQVLSSEVTFLISSILSDANTRAEEFGNLLNISRSAAVKTGTTENYKDAWTLGYTPSLVVGVWVGNNDNTQMDNIAGSLGAAPIWRKLMERFLLGTPIEKFSLPDGVSGTYICRNNGLLLKNPGATSSAMMEYFIKGTEPVKDCFGQGNVITGYQITSSPLSPSTPQGTLSPTPSISPSVSPSDSPTIQAPTAFPLLKLQEFKRKE